MDIKFEQVTNIELDGVAIGDYPDFCDAYIMYAEHSNGVPLTDEQLDILNELDEAKAYVNENAFETLLD